MKTGTKVTVARIEWDLAIGDLKKIASTLWAMDGRPDKLMGRHILKAIQMLEQGEALISED